MKHKYSKKEIDAVKTYYFDKSGLAHLRGWPFNEKATMNTLTAQIIVIKMRVKEILRKAFQR